MNIKEIETKVDYIGRDEFIKFSNAKNFPALDNATQKFLSETGIYSTTQRVPFVTTKGELKDLGKGLIEFGVNDIDYQFCIDTSNANRIVAVQDETGRIGKVNSSLEKYIECIYAMRYYVKEFEVKDVFGEYDKNRKKYAQKLLNLFNEVEGDITQYPLWYGQVSERELGIL